MTEYRNAPLTIEGTVLSRESTNTTALVRNTYMLLGMTLVWSAALSVVGTQIAWSTLGMIACMVAGFGALFATMYLRNSVWGLAAVFGFTGLMGLSLGPTLTHYLAMPNGGSLVSQAVGLTALVTFGLSAYVVKSGRDFSRWGGFLFAGLITVLIASIAAIFIPAMQAAVASASALLFSGFILFDTSRLVRGEEDNYIMATVSMYLNILNLFLALLRLLGGFGSDD